MNYLSAITKKVSGRTLGRRIQLVAYVGVLFAIWPLSINPLEALGGLQGTKLNVSAPESLEPGVAIFEPGFSLYRAGSRFNEYAHRKDLPDDYDKRYFSSEDSHYSENGISFRFTMGLAHDLEAGISYGHSTRKNSSAGFPLTHFSDLQNGLKYMLFTNPYLQIALQGAVYIETEQWTPDYHGGLIVGTPPDLDSPWSIDFEIWTSRSVRRGYEFGSSPWNGWGANLGISRRFGNLMPAIELGYSTVWSRQFRYFRAGRWAEVNGNLSEDEAFIDPLPVILQFAGMESSTTELKALQGRPHWMLDRYTAREEVFRISMGLIYDVSSFASLTAMFTRELAGKNVYDGTTFTAAFTFKFDHFKTENSGSSNSVSSN